MKIKKILSTLLSVAMLSALAPSMAMAATTINRLEADAECITIYSSQALDTTMLKNAITLTEDGEAVNVTVEAVKTSSTYPNTLSSAPSYKIIPQGGMEFDTAYNLSIGEALLGSTYNKAFEVTKVFEDNFDATGADASKWTYDQTAGSQSGHSIAVVDKSLHVKAPTGGVTYYQVLFPAENGSPIKFDDGVTVQFDLVRISSTGTFFFGFAESTSGFLNSKGMRGKCSIADNQTISSSIPTAADYGASTSSGYSKHKVGSTFVDIIGSVTKSGNTVTVNSMTNYKQVSSAAEGRNSLYVNGIKYLDYTNTYYKRNGYYGIAINDNVANNAAFRIDNFIVTQLVEYIDTTPAKDGYDIDEDVVITLSSNYDAAALEKLKTDEVITAYGDLFTITKKGGEKITDFTATPVEGKTNSFTLSFANDLEYKSEYEIVIDEKLPISGGAGCKFNKSGFKTIAPAFDLETFKVEAGTVKAVLRNNRVAEGVNCMATIVLYDANNMMIDVMGGVKAIPITDGSNYAEITIEAGDAVTAKCYAWDSFTGMNTLLEGTLTLD